MQPSLSNRSIFICGDMALPAFSGGAMVSTEVTEYLLSYETRVCNLEAPFIKPGFARAAKAGPHLAQHDALKNLLETGLFQIANLANNHIMDYGAEGLQHTMNLLDGLGIGHFGAGRHAAEAYEPYYIQLAPGFKVAFIGLGEAQFGCIKEDLEKPGYAWVFHKKAVEAVRKAKAEAQAVIVMPHAGLEMEELPLPEWRECYRALIDEGATAVVASHPHVVQGKELYNGRWIYYSLGNWFFPKGKKGKWEQSLGVGFSFSADGQVAVEEKFFTFSDGPVAFDASVEAESNFTELSRKLLPANEQAYRGHIDQLCKQQWENTYKKYYAYLVFNEQFNKLPSPIAKVVGKLVSRYLRGGKEMLLLHNLRIETHRFVVERALKNILNA